MQPDRSSGPDVADGRYDVAVMPPSSRVKEGLRRGNTHKLKWAVFARGDHPAGPRLSKKGWAAYPHLLIRTPGSSDSPVDRASRQGNLKRRVTQVLPHFMLAPPLLAQSDLLLTVPRVALASAVKAYDLRVMACPVSVPAIEVALQWGARFDLEPASVWFRGHLAAALRTTLNA